MREIKFRVWQGETKSMESVNSLYTKWQDKRVLLLLPNGDDCIIMQYTGLKDKNGVEIFEGDIVKYSTLPGTISTRELVPGKLTQVYEQLEGTGEVVWMQRYCAFHITTNDPDIFEGLDGNLVVEVVGNIWENKELLK